MTDDLVKRLRNNCSCNFSSTPCGAEEECRNAFEAADRIEKLEQALAHATELDAMLADRFRRSSPVEEKLLAAGMGKAPLPTQEVCMQWAVKLGIPAP